VVVFVGMVVVVAGGFDVVVATDLSTFWCLDPVYGSSCGAWWRW
jgi:hypothetical protein